MYTVQCTRMYVLGLIISPDESNSDSPGVHTKLLLPSPTLSILLHNVNVKYVHITRRNTVLGRRIDKFML